MIEKNLATSILEQIIILNNYDTKTKEFFGYSDKSTSIEIVLNNLLDIFFNLSGVDKFAMYSDKILNMILECENWVEVGNLYIHIKMIIDKEYN